jgi:hypothetical protein
MQYVHKNTYASQAREHGATVTTTIFLKTSHSRAFKRWVLDSGILARKDLEQSGGGSLSSTEAVSVAKRHHTHAVW